MYDTLSIKNLRSMLLHTTNDIQIFYLSCSHLVFNISLLFILILNFIKYYIHGG
jgi:hypothetical protein